MRGFLEDMRGTVCPAECGGCGDVRWRPEQRTHLLLPVPGRGATAEVDLEDMIDVAERLERLELGGTFSCPACGAGVDPFRLVRFEKPPSTLAMQFIRFVPEGAKWVKYHVPVRCPPLLRFPPARLQGAGGEQPLSSSARPCCTLGASRLGTSRQGHAGMVIGGSATTHG